MKLRDVALLFLMLLVTFAAGCLLGKRYQVSQEVSTIVQDSAVYVDTLRDSSPPVPIIEIDLGTVEIPVPMWRLEEAFASQKDTVRDTVYVQAPRMQRFYETHNYRAWVSGIDPRLDSMDIFQKTVYINQPVKPKNWAISAFGGIETNNVNTVYSAGLELSFGLPKDRWTFELQGGVRYEPALFTPYLEASMYYRIW